MEEIITNELIQYKTGFIHGKNDFLEFTRLGKVIDLEVKEAEATPEWYAFGYQDAIEFFSNATNQNVDIATIRVKEVIKEQYLKRVMLYNSENQKETPISTFRM